MFSSSLKGDALYSGEEDAQIYGEETSLKGEALHTIVAVMLGWAFEAFDFMLFSMLAIPVMTTLNIDRIAFGLAISVGLIGTVIGGIGSGILADRFGRVKVLMTSLLIYGAATIGIALSRTFYELILFRFIVGLGLGAEWSTGMTLVAEIVPAEKRGFAVGLVQSGWPLGVLIAIADTILIYPIFGWRAAFAVASIPVLLVIYVRSKVPESTLWLQSKDKEKHRISLLYLFSRKLVSRTLIGLAIDVLAMFSYWMFWSWVPVFLAKERGFTVVRSAEWLIITQVGAWLGYISYGYLQDKLGRRITWTIFTASEATMILAYVLLIKDPLLMLAAGLFLGFFTGFWSGFGAVLSELFPTKVRSTALGFIFNTGRGINFISPVLVAWLSLHLGWGAALSVAALSAYIASALIWLFPETKGIELK